MQSRMTLLFAEVSDAGATALAEAGLSTMLIMSKAMPHGMYTAWRAAERLPTSVGDNSVQIQEGGCREGAHHSGPKMSSGVMHALLWQRICWQVLYLVPI